MRKYYNKFDITVITSIFVNSNVVTLLSNFFCISEPLPNKIYDYENFSKFPTQVFIQMRRFKIVFKALTT